MDLALVGHVQPVRLFQRSLFMRIDIHATFGTFLAHISPAVARHPFAFTLGTFVLSEAASFPLVRRQALALWLCLRAIFDVVTLIEAEMAEVSGRRSFRRFGVQQVQIGETVGNIVADVVREIVRYGRSEGGPWQIGPARESVPDRRHQFALIRRRYIVIGDR